ncbi:MAG TPA: hypothetical protein VN651_04335 [Gemmatimonadaceae bacterium]|nr:hypothetical protein [Gemmatimonadaceae bacterium]
MRSMILLLGLGALAAACGRTKNGDVVVKRPSGMSVQTTQDTLHLPTIGTHQDTVKTPVIGTRTETLVVKKPVIGTKKSVVTVPGAKKP